MDATGIARIVGILVGLIALVNIYLLAKNDIKFLIFFIIIGIAVGLYVYNTFIKNRK